MKLYKNVFGDVNGDGTVNISDLTRLIELLNGREQQNARGDWDNDGDIDTSDVSILVNLLLNK